MQSRELSPDTKRALQKDLQADRVFRYLILMHNALPALIAVSPRNSCRFALPGRLQQGAYKVQKGKRLFHLS